MSTIVLHNLPVGCMESDIHRALLIYGTAVNIEMDARASRAVVTMRTQQEAQALLNRHSVNVSGTSVRVDPQPSQAAGSQPQQLQQQQHFQPHSMGAAGYLYAQPPPGAMHPGMAPSVPVQQQQSFFQPNMGGSYNNSSIAPPPTHLPRGSGDAIMPAPPQTTRRLKVVVEDCRYPITRDVLVRMFSMIAAPVTVSCGPYGPTTTGLVEFAEASSAQQAMDQFHGKAIYPDCCYVKLAFEPMWEVPPAPGFAAKTSPPAMGAPNTSGYLCAEQMGMPANLNAYIAPANTDLNVGYPGWDPRGGGYGRGDGAPYPPSTALGRGQSMRNGDDGRREYVTDGGRGLGRGGEVAHPGLMVRGGRGVARGTVRGGGSGAPIGFSPYSVPTVPSARVVAAEGEPGMGGRPPIAPPTDSAVLVSGVPESVPLYDLWVLLEVYGNVRSLKRQHTDRTQVVAQFQHATDTVMAVQYLHGCPFRGSKLRLKRFFGYQERNTEWNLGRATDPSTFAALFEKDYHHRVSPHMPRNPRSAMYPDKNLFVSNLTDNVTETELEEMWRRAGFDPVTSYRRGPKTSIVGFKNVETAVDALVAMHLKECQGRTLYVTFSRFPPGPHLSKDDHEGVQEGERDDGEDHVEESDERHTSTFSANITTEYPQTEKTVSVGKAGGVADDAAAHAEEMKAAPKNGKNKGRSAKK